jgi:LysR family glycine cleavage system transcriptional activator
MENRLPNLIWLRSFEAAARHLNFTRAADELGLTQTAVSLHIRSLEAELGCKLFLRAPRNLSLTALGQAYMLTVRRALGDITRSTTSLFGPVGEHTLTVKVPVSTATLWLAPRLHDFSARHPNIKIRLISNIWAGSTEAEDIDVELRLGLGDWTDVATRLVAEETIVPVGAATGDPGALSESAQIHILGYEDNWHRYMGARGLTYDPSAGRFSVDTSIAAIELAASGAGVAIVVGRYASAAIETGHRIALVGPEIPFAQSHYLTVAQTDARARPEAELFESWLCAHLAQG